MEKEFGSSALADDDLLNCFTWAAGEPGENSPSSAAAGSSTSFLKDSPRRGGGGGRGAGGAGFDTVFDPTGAEDGEAALRGTQENQYVKDLEAKVAMLSGRLNAVHSATTGMPMPMMPQMAPPQHMYPGMAPGMAALAGGKRAAAAQGGGNAKKLSRRGSQSSKQAQQAAQQQAAQQQAQMMMMQQMARQRAPGQPPGVQRSQSAGAAAGGGAAGSKEQRRASREATRDSVASLVERFVDNRRRRQQTIDAHLDEVDDALSQGNPVKFAFWGLDQDASFYQTPGSGPAKLLEVLGREIGLTTEQMLQLGTHRHAIRHDRESLSKAHALLRQARAQIHDHIASSSAIMEHLRRILSPVQVAKFFVWVEKHQQSVKALTALWDAPADGDEGGDGAADGEGGKQDDAAPKEAADGDAATDTTAATPPPAAPDGDGASGDAATDVASADDSGDGEKAAASDGDGATAGDGTTPPPTAGAADGDSDTPATAADGGEAPAPELADSVKQREAPAEPQTVA